MSGKLLAIAGEAAHLDEAVISSEGSGGKAAGTCEPFVSSAFNVMFYGDSEGQNQGSAPIVVQNVHGTENPEMHAPSTSQ